MDRIFELEMDNLMVMERLTNPETENKKEVTLIGVSEQLKNIDIWNKKYDLGLPNTELLIGEADQTSTLEHAVVITPNLGSTEATFLMLWDIIKDNYAGNAQEAFPGESPYEKYAVLAIDEELTPAILSQRTVSFTNPGSRFTHQGPREIERPTNRLSVAEIDVTTFYVPLPEGTQNIPPELRPIAPYEIRTPQNAPGVEVLAFLAHNPDYVDRMCVGGEDSLPWLWVPGIQIHDIKGNMTPRTPLISVDNTNKLVRLTAVWNDAGNTYASVPTFVKTPSTI